MGEDRLHIQLFGEIAVTRNGKTLSLPQSKKTRALLAYLILNDGPHRREKLCELFWEIPDDPRGSLRWSLSKLRGVVNDEGSERIVADRNMAAFEDKGATIDFRQIDVAALNPSQYSIEELQKLADLFQKGFLEDVVLSTQADFETWRLAEQEKARKYFREILLALIVRFEDTPSEQADKLYLLTNIDPYNVDVHAQLISALMKSGREKEAERQLQRSNELLLGVEGVDVSRLKLAMQQAPVAPIRAQTQLQQEIRYCKSVNGAQIAYATVGEGPPVLKTANWLNHLEFDWESPVWSHFFSAIARSNTLVRYDARGNGLSDWRIKDFSFGRNVEDLEAVIEASGHERIALLGFSQGCAISARFAALHPDKVSKLILYGGYARGWNVETPLEMKNSTRAMITLMRTGWGQDNPVFRQMFASLFMPDAPPENHEWFNELQRMTTSPENAAKCLEGLGDVDVRDCLKDVKAQTLVIHARGDMRVPLESAKELASGIPNAQLITLETNNHLIPEMDPAWPKFRDTIAAFLAE